MFIGADLAECVASSTSSPTLHVLLLRLAVCLRVRQIAAHGVELILPTRVRSSRTGRRSSARRSRLAIVVLIVILSNDPL